MLLKCNWIYMGNNTWRLQTHSWLCEGIKGEKAFAPWMCAASDIKNDAFLWKRFQAERDGRAELNDVRSRMDWDNPDINFKEWARSQQHACSHVSFKLHFILKLRIASWKLRLNWFVEKIILKKREAAWILQITFLHSPKFLYELLADWLNSAILNTIFVCTKVSRFVGGKDGWYKNYSCSYHSRIERARVASCHSKHKNYTKAHWSGLRREENTVYVYTTTFP